MKPQRILCAWCSQYFDWTPNGPNVTRKRYCNRSHKEAAHKAGKWFRMYFSPGVCPTPSKRSFATNEDARRWMDTFPERSGGNRSYLCNCGAFHFGRVKRDIKPPKGSPAAVQAKERSKERKLRRNSVSDPCAMV